jgi:hypothetical protein
MANNRPNLKRTESSFNNDVQTNRAQQIRRDNDTIKTPTCTLYDIDFAIMWYLQNKIDPRIVENGTSIQVPVQYANGEKWAQIQKHGYMRDNNNKLMAPIMTIRRSSVTERPDMHQLDTYRNPESPNGQQNFVMTLKNNYTVANRYDRFGLLHGVKPTQEYYVLQMPTYIDVSYDLHIWADNVEQLNGLVEGVVNVNGFAWGDTWKFTTVVNDFSMETINDAGSDRIVSATTTLAVKGAILTESQLKQSSMQKAYSVKQVVFKTETQVPPPGGYNNNR